MGKWSKKFDSCQGCGTTERKHLANGYCYLCDKRIRRGLPAVPVAPTSSDVFIGGRGLRKCCECQQFKPYGPGPNGEPSEFHLESRMLKSGKRMNNGYRHICIPCNRKRNRDGIAKRRAEQREQKAEVG